MPALSRLKSALTPATPVEKANADLEAARAELANAEPHLSGLLARQGDIELDGSADEKRAHREMIEEARGRLAAATTRVARAEKAFTDAQEAELDRKIAEAEKAAKADRSRFETALTERYPAARDIILDILALGAKAEISRNAYEAARRPESAPMPPVEVTVRGRSGTERHIISERTVRLWTYAGTGQKIRDEDVPRVQKRGGDAGFLPSTEWGPHAKPVQLRAFREVSFVPESRADWLAPLAESLSLPALRAGEPAPWSPLIGSPRPGDVLDAIERRRAAATAGPAKPTVVTELIPVDDTAEDAASAA